MSLVFRVPPWRREERRYVLSVIVREWLGLDFVMHVEERNDTHISHESACDAVAAPALCLPDSFLSSAHRKWLDATTLPSSDLVTCDASGLAHGSHPVRPRLPVLFGAPPGQPSEFTAGVLQVPIDILGAAFFMLSRYEEAVTPHRDEHGRFPASASLAYRAGFLDRPIVDEYVEILWAAMHRLWPRLERKRHEPRVRVSCDVDHPFLVHGGPRRVLRRIGGDLLKRRSPTRAFRTALAWPLASLGNHAFDEFRRNIDWMMDVNEKHGNTVAFNFIPENTHPSMDSAPSLNEPRMRQLLRSIHERGHEVGFHPGYCTYRHPDAFAKSIATLRRVMDDERIDQQTLGGRQHYLRWETPTTARLWDDHGLDFDSTLSYADHAGFRCGTCREYPLFDVVERKPLRLRERPLIAMEASVMEDAYMGLGHGEDAANRMLQLKAACRTVQGDFSVLWHNSYFDYPNDRATYRTVVEGCHAAPGCPS